MSTRSKIGILRKDGTVDHVYSHWDGYPEHNGVILLSEYNNINKMNHLIKNGDMSILGEKVLTKDYLNYWEENSDVLVPNNDLCREDSLIKIKFQ